MSAQQERCSASGDDDASQHQSYPKGGNMQPEFSTISSVTASSRQSVQVEGLANEASAFSAGSGIDALNQVYFKLLGTGKLASKDKHKRTDIPTKSGATEDDDQPQSVFDSHLQHLKTTANKLDFTPLQPLSTSQQQTADRTPVIDQQPDHEIKPDSADTTTCESISNVTNEAKEKRITHRPNSSKACNDRRPISAGLPATSTYCKMYTPGPGAYSPQVDRKGGWNGTAFGFGTARQRPAYVCIQEPKPASPGPIYNPRQVSLSTQSAPPTCRFGKELYGTRHRVDSTLPSNHPIWNPGPGQYISNDSAAQPRCSAVFGNSQKLVSPQTNLQATPFVSREHAMKENQGVHSPGPAVYSPMADAVRPKGCAHTLGSKAPSYFDTFLDPRKQQSPGPIYEATHTDKKGSRIWGATPNAAFGKSAKEWAPETRMSATAFISREHARTNQGVHSPGPIYAPKIRAHVRTPLLTSGPPDRFYDGFEPGRLQ